MTCDEPLDGGKKVCGRPATVFAMSNWYCRIHEPKGATSCSHSLVGTDRCAYCGTYVGDATNR